MARVTRFAPSPTGPLHLGHAFAALVAAGRGDRFLIRIEDIDRTRSKPEYTEAIFDDLAWLGLSWETPVLHQSKRINIYEQRIEKLTELGITYHCTCTRGDIRVHLSAPQEGATIIGPDGPVYPGTCRDAGHREGAIRLDMAKAVALAGEITFTETGTRAGTHRRPPAQMTREIGDIVLARRDIGTSYHIAVVSDDAAQGITEVTRGEDLFDATFIHALLIRLLGLPQPVWHHHRLIRDEAGKRLAKRDDARALSRYRSDGLSPQDILNLLEMPIPPG